MDANFPDLNAMGFCDDDVIPGAMNKDGIWQIYDRERFDEWWHSEDSRITVAKVFVDDAVFANHYFRLPRVGEEGFYQTLTSWSAFRHREQKKCRFPHEKQVDYSYPLKQIDVRVMFRSPHDRNMDYSFQKRVDAKFDVMDTEVTKNFCHRNLWDLYLAIGYDYKQQRYKLEQYEQSRKPKEASEPTSD